MQLGGLPTAVVIDRRDMSTDEKSVGAEKTEEQCRATERALHPQPHEYAGDDDTMIGFVNVPAISILLVAFNFGIYANSLYNGFAFDDYLGIVNNADVDHLKVPFEDLFRHDLWGKPLLNMDSHRYYHNHVRLCSRTLLVD